jgi:hypothetical protein
MAEIPPLLEVQPDRQKPARQAGLGLLEHGAGQQRMLLAAGDTLVDQPPPMLVGRPMAAALAAKALRPAPGEEVGPALGVGPELGQKRGQIPRQLVRYHGGLHVLASFTLPAPPPPSTRLSVVES